MLIKRFPILLFVALAIAACSPENGGDPASKHKISLSGHVQKGPFVKGATVTVTALGEDMTPYGDVFQAEVMDAMGTFTISGETDAPYLELKAEGRYFDEISGEVSAEPVSLGALVKADCKNVNINLLTTVAASRVKILMGDGKTLPAARFQAQDEFLNAFGIRNITLNFEEMDIAASSDADAFLLAFSCMILNGANARGIVSLVQDISDDFAPDGKISPQLVSGLRSGVVEVSPFLVICNLAEYYSEKDLRIDTVPAFYRYISPEFDEGLMIVEEGWAPDNGIRCDYDIISEEDFTVEADVKGFSVEKTNILGAAWQVVCRIPVNDEDTERTVLIYFKDASGNVLESRSIVQEGTSGGPGPDDPVPDQPDERVSVPGWYELPVMNVTANGNYKVDAGSSSVYYAWHMCAGGEKGPGGRTARNYTVCFSAEKHCPLWIAAPRHDLYEGSAKRTNAYGTDPSIPADIQYHSKDTGGGCNKGHMLGSAERTSSTATNRQVFYYSNIAPQLSSGFNTGGGGWNNLEDWVDGQVCSDTLYIVIGTWFETFTDGYGNTVQPKTITFGGRDDVGFPTMYYYLLLRTKKGNSGKALKDCSADEIKCAAFVRAHTNSLKGQEVTSRDLMSIADLEKITGFDYFPNVPAINKNRVVASDWGL